MKDLVKKQALEFISGLDYMRWNGETENYSELNLYDSNITEEDKILSHWISYISDRQMPFEKIWIFGGYVYSKIIYDWHKCNNSIEKINEVFNQHIETFHDKKGKEKARIFVKYDKKNERIDAELLEDTSEIEFTSRFYTTDIVYIYLTLLYLALNYNSSLFSFLQDISSWTEDSYKKIKSIAYGLYLLSYKDNKQHNFDDIKKFKSKNNEKILFREEYDAICKNIKIFKEHKDEELDKFDNEYKRYNGLKRLWCCIRDYLKAYFYKDYFNRCLNKFKINIDDNAKQKMIQYVELPGDVWNNNSKFRNCILNEHHEKIKKEKTLSRVLREDYINNRELWNRMEVYPESFDVSFNLAMRMCSNNKCSYCLMKNKSNAKELCTNRKGGICLVAMVYCGYVFRCCGIDSCKLGNLIK